MDPIAHLDPELLRAALRTMGEGITLSDAAGRIIYSNPAADRILGVTATDAPPSEWAKHYGVFVPDTDIPFPTEEYPLVRALAGEATNDVLMLVRNAAIPDGALISVTGRPVANGEGSVKGAAVVFRDVTALKAAESEIRAALASLEETSRQKEELLGFLIHDMKNPLTSILAAAELLMMDRRSGEPDRQDLTEILTAGRTLHRMILDLLDIQVAEDGGLTLDLETVPLPRLLERAGAGARSRGARVMIDSPEDAELQVDAAMMDRVLGNLVDNCIKYGPPGGRIWLEAWVEEDGRTVIRVRDEGPGVPPHLREAVFDKYARVERDVSRRRAGSRGLGLRFCKVAVEAHGGRIWVEDGVPTGAAFCVELPGVGSEPR